MTFSVFWLSGQSRKKNMSGDVYEVEKLTASRVRRGIKQYLVKWRGHSKQTWEPQENILAPTLIENFNARQKKGKHASQSM